MESIALIGPGRLEAAGPSGQTPAPGAILDADAGEVGAFIVALLTQIEAATPDEEAAPGGTPLPDAEVEVAQELPPEGLIFAAAPSILPPTMQLGGDALEPALGPLPGAATALPPRPSGPRSVAVAASSETRPFELSPASAHGTLVETVLPSSSAAVGAVDASEALVVASDVAARTIAGAASTATSEAPIVPVVNRAGEGVAQPEPSVGKASALPVAQPEVFAERINQQIAVMVSANAQHARIAVNPPQLGPVEVSVSVVGDEATVILAAAHAVTREVLEEALPRLRGAFSESGVVLGEAGVYSELPERREAQPRSQAAPEHRDGAIEEHATDPGEPLRLVRLGLVDAFV